jgi:hypothetical protein
VKEREELFEVACEPLDHEVWVHVLFLNTVVQMFVQQWHWVRVWWANHKAFLSINQLDMSEDQYSPGFLLRIAKGVR